MNTHTKIDFSQFTNDQLDTIYEKTVGYRPIAEDGQTREQAIDLIASYEHEHGVTIPSQIENSPQGQKAISHTFPIITEYKGYYLKTVKSGNLFDTFSFSDKTLTQPVKAMACQPDIHNSIERSKAKIDLLIQEQPTQHTPGPWAAHKMGNTTYYYQIETRNGKWIADVKNIDSHSEANARLIALAPEMLELIQTLRDKIANHDEWWMNDPNKGGFDLDKINSLLSRASQ